MGIQAVNGHLPVEHLLGELHGHMEYVKQQHEMFLYEMEQKKRLKRRKTRGLKTTQVKGLKFKPGECLISTLRKKSSTTRIC